MEVEENPNSKLPRRSEETLEDLTQRLPDHIITYILGLLASTRKSIQTSVLSKRWESFWASAPVLTFNQHNDQPISQNLDQPFEVPSHEFCSWVDKTLIQCDSDVNLQAFKLHFYFEAQYKPRVDRRLRHATRRNVKDISSNFHGYVLPLFLCRCSTLTDLYIDGCSFPPLPIRFSWSSMKVLSLSGDSFRDGNVMYAEMFEAIQSSCPLLEKWEICMDFREGVYRFNSLTLKSLSIGNTEVPPSAVIEIWAPNLNIFTNYTMGNWKAINFVDVSSLLDVTICYDGRNHMSPKLMNQALGKLHGVEKFFFALIYQKQIFSKLQATEMTPIVLGNCKDLKLMVDLSNTTLPDLLFLLSVSPNLKKLTLDMNIIEDEGEWKTPKSSFCCLKSHLTTIDVIIFDTDRLRSKYLRRFLKFVLRNALLLEKLRIITKDRFEFEEKVSRLILSYKKASRNAVVKFEWGKPA